MIERRDRIQERNRGKEGTVEEYQMDREMLGVEKTVNVERSRQMLRKDVRCWEKLSNGEENCQMLRKNYHMLRKILIVGPVCQFFF